MKKIFIFSILAVLIPLITLSAADLEHNEE